MTQTKEELKERFIGYARKETTLTFFVPEDEVDSIFDFFWKEIEAREKRIKQWEDAINIMGVHTKTVDMAETILNQNVKISHLQATLEAADECVRIANSFGIRYEDQAYSTALNEYNQLKTKSQS